MFRFTSLNSDLGDLSTQAMIAYVGEITREDQTLDVSDYKILIATLFVNGAATGIGLVSPSGSYPTIIEYLGSTLNRNACTITVDIIGGSYLCSCQFAPYQSNTLKIMLFGQKL